MVSSIYCVSKVTEETLNVNFESSSKIDISYTESGFFNNIQKNLVYSTIKKTQSNTVTT